MAEEKVTFGDPHDPLTIMANTAVEAIEDACEQLGWRFMVMIVDPTQEPMRSGSGLTGYDSPVDALTDLLQQAKAIAHTMGREIVVAPLNRG